MSTQPTLSTGGDASCRFCCAELRTEHCNVTTYDDCYEKVCKPRCKRISLLIDDHKQTMAIAKGLAYHRKYRVWSPSCFSTEAQVTLSGASSCTQHTDARLKVKPLLKPINDYSKLGAFKKSYSGGRKKRPRRVAAQRTFISKSSPLSNIVYPIRKYDPLHSNSDAKARLNSRKIGRNKFQDAIGADRIYRLKSQERIIIHEGIPKGLNAPLPHEHSPFKSSSTLPQPLKKNACVALQETAFTSCFVDMPQQHPSSPDTTDKAFNWNDQRVLLAPSLSDAGSKVESPESGHPTMLSKSDQFICSKENAKASALRKSFFKSIKFRQLGGEHRQYLDPQVYSKKTDSPSHIIAYTPPLRDLNGIDREVETANQGHVVSQLRLLQLALQKPDDDESTNITPTTT